GARSGAATAIPTATTRAGPGPGVLRRRARLPRQRPPMADAPVLSGDAAAALQRFLGHLSSRNSSPGTIREYRRHVAQFFAFLDSRGIDWRAPDRATVRAYLGTLAERGLSASTVGGQLAAIRSLYRHAARQGWI